MADPQVLPGPVPVPAGFCYRCSGADADLLGQNLHFHGACYATPRPRHPADELTSALWHARGDVFDGAEPSPAMWDRVVREVTDWLDLYRPRPDPTPSACQVAALSSGTTDGALENVRSRDIDPGGS
jgi:hypothetical protein